MKKFISMVMAAAMVVSLVPATAFAADATGNVKVIDKVERQADASKTIVSANAAEVQIEVESAYYATTNPDYELDVTVAIDGAELLGDAGQNVKDLYEDYFGDATADWASVLEDNIHLYRGNTKHTLATDTFAGTTVKVKDLVVENENEFSFTIYNAPLLKDDILAIDLAVEMDDNDAGSTATVSVESDIVDSEALVFAEYMDKGIKATVKKVAEVAVEEVVDLERDLKIESIVGDFVDNQVFELKLSKGFEFASSTASSNTSVYTFGTPDENEMEVTFVGGPAKSFTIEATDLDIEAVSADAGDVCTLTVKAKKVSGVGFTATAEAVEVVKVLADTIIMSVDEDEDVPEMYSGVNAVTYSAHTGYAAVSNTNYGITDDSDHKSLKVTIEESVEDAWDLVKGFELGLPEGVYVVGISDITSKGLNGVNQAAFEKAYDKGNFKGFEFGRRAFTESTTTEKSEITFTLTLVADPGFTGDVALTLSGAGMDDAQEVVIATFLAPAAVEAAQNDLIIDYRNTAVPTEIVVTETEAGLWEDGEFEVVFGIDDNGNNLIQFEDDADYAVNEDSDMEIDDEIYAFGFAVDKESDDEAAVVTISGIELFMQRNIPAGAYDLTMGGAVVDAYLGQPIFAANFDTTDRIDYIADVTDADGIVKEAFINVITAGRDQDDASFTKKVVVPVGESYIVAGEETVTLDVPAYVSAAGYTMLPVRAVAVALGINTNNVLWDQATKTVTILYGQRIITMTVGSKAINVNGSAIPASASPEVVDGRTFLPMRDLATALGVTDITWDAATKTATLNGNK